MATDSRLEEIRQRRATIYSSESFATKPESKAIAGMLLPDIDFLLSEIDRLKGEDVEVALAELRKMFHPLMVDVHLRTGPNAKYARISTIEHMWDAPTLAEAMQKVREWKGKQQPQKEHGIVHKPDGSTRLFRK